jgi:hypothetical protein
MKNEQPSYSPEDPVMSDVRYPGRRSVCSRRDVLRGAVSLSLCGVLNSRRAQAVLQDDRLLGYWPLRDDARDHSGHGLHGTDHGAARTDGRFDGRSSFVEIPAHPALELGQGDFSIAAWIKADDSSTDITGDVINKWDPAARRGFTLCVKGSSGGYNSHGSERNVHFGIDQAQLGEWEDCGRPSPTSNYVSNSLTVFDGNLYAATTDGASPADWCHVYRYAGGQNWEDCGRVGQLKTRGVGPLVVHKSQLYAANWSYDWERVERDDLDWCRVYRYAGGREWEDCGQPGQCRRLFGMASFAGRLYVVGDDNRCHVYEGNRVWSVSHTFRKYVHPMAVHDGKLHVGAFGGAIEGKFYQAEVVAFDGRAWSSAGNPMNAEDHEDQIHALHVYEGKLHATTWPSGKVWALEPSGKWAACGRLGTSTESNALHVYNGKLYAGTIPWAEVFRHEGGTDWTHVKRFCPQEVVDAVHLRQSRRWGRVTSLTTFAGKMYASVGSYTSSIQDAPPDIRGRVFSVRAGDCVSYNRDVGSQWRFLTAVRRNGRLELYLDGECGANSAEEVRGLDISNRSPLRIGFGPTDYFSGMIREVRLWNIALSAEEIGRMTRETRPE